MRRLTLALLTLYAFAVPWEFSLDLGEPLGNVARILTLAAFAVAVPATLARARLRRWHSFEWAVLAYMLYFVLSCLWSVALDDSLDRARGYAQVMLPVWLLWEFTEDERELLHLKRAVVAGCWVLALLTLGALLHLATNPTPEDAASLMASQTRFSASGQDPNDVARFLDLGLPLAAWLAVTEKNRLRWLWAGYLLVGFVAVLATASRGGFLGSLAAFAGVILLFWTHRRRVRRTRRRWRVAVATLLPLALVATLALIPRGSFERLMTIPQQIESGDLNGRVTIWQAGWAAFNDAPYLGHGAGTYEAAARTSTGDTAHNTFISVLVTGGLCGFMLLAAVLVSVIRPVFGTCGSIRIALATELAVWLVTAMVQTVDENRMTWLVFSLVILSARRFAPPQPAMTSILASEPA